MPLVVTQNLATEEGHRYRDLLGAQYEYPKRYQGLMRTGEPFVYYRGRRGRARGDLLYAYIGAGVVGEITPSEDPRLLIALIEDYTPFSASVPLRPDGGYIEHVPAGRGSATGMFFRRSVRPLDEQTYRRILALAGELVPLVATPAEPAPGYADPQHARDIDEVGMELAERAARDRWPAASVVRMPHNNPGYDLLITLDDGPWYVEVKSTAGSVGQFFLTEGERVFAERHSSRYSLLLISEVDPVAQTGRNTWRDGALVGEDLVLRPGNGMGGCSASSYRVRGQAGRARTAPCAAAWAARRRG